jgi:hypothetical protein
MCRYKTVRNPLSEKKFCGERKLGNCDAPLDQTRRPRRKLAARRIKHDRNPAQPAESRGPAGVNSRFAGRARGGVRSPSDFRPRFSALPNSVDSPKLFTYRIARWSCITAAPVVGRRSDACSKGKYEGTLLRIQPSVVNVGGTAVA